MNHDLKEFEFGAFTLSVSDGLLTHGGQTVKLPPKVFQALAMLVSANGGIVTKEDLFAQIWKDTFVADNALSFTISQLRKSLARLDPDTEYIETVPKRGFRMAVPVKANNSGALAASPEFTVERTHTEEIWYEPPAGPIRPEPLALPPKSHSISRIAIVAALGLAIVLAGGGFLYWRQNKVRAVRSIAVLPLKQLGTTDDDSLNVRVTDSLITKIATLRQVTVRPTSSILKLTVGNEEPVELGKRLEVDAVVDGRIQSEGDNIRVNIQMLSVPGGDQLWAEQFDGKAGRILDLQDAITAKLIGHLNLDLSAEQATEFSKKRTTNAEAYDEYLRGRFMWNKRTPAGLHSAITAYRRAIELDPTFAEAYVGLADSYYLLFDYSYDTSPRNVEIANENLNRALELDPGLTDAYTLKGHIQSVYEWNWAGAEESFNKALELSPNSSNALHRFAVMLIRLNRLPEAEAKMLEARRLDPTSTGINMNLGAVYYFARQYDKALAQLDKAVELDPGFASPYWYRGRCYLMKGDLESTRTAYIDASRRSDDQETVKILEKAPPGTNFLDDLARSWSQRIGPNDFNEYDLAILAAFRGNDEETLNWLERSLAAHHPWLSTLNAEPVFDRVRNTDRFQAVLQKIGLR